MIEGRECKAQLVYAGHHHGGCSVRPCALFVTRRLFPPCTDDPGRAGTAEVVVWGYGSVTAGWSLAGMLLWMSNGLVVTAIALGGQATNRTTALGRPNTFPNHGRIHAFH